MDEPRIAYVTHASDFDPDLDLPYALPAMREVGLDPVAVAWDADVDWSEFDLAVVRSPWDYLDRRQEFLRWARIVENSTRLANPARILARNSDKTYLRDLAYRGLAVIPTLWVEPGDDDRVLLEAIGDRAWQRCVVKPNVSGGARYTYLVESAAEAAVRARELTAMGYVAMVQPYLPQVEDHAEVAVVVLGGQISHAVSRVPPLTQGGYGQALEQVPVSEALAEFVHESLPYVADGEPLLYARVDVVEVDGRWLVMELEATEPALFLETVPAAALTFARAVRAHLTDELP